MYISKEEFIHILRLIGEKEVGDFSTLIYPQKGEDENLYFDEYKDKTEIILNSYRTVDPLRLFYYFPREKVYPTNNEEIKRLIAGVTACDLRSLKVLDKALLEGDFVDPVYEKWRNNTYLISSDCEEINETCHCTLVDGKPYPQDNYDLNLASYEENYFLQTNSKKGQELLQLIQKVSSLEEISESGRERISKNRKSIVNKLQEQNRNYNYPEDYSELKKLDPDKWKGEQSDCIGCGACTNICPTCYCIILNDESTQEEFIKVRSQDSCQLYGYSMVAAGDSPRPKMRDRFRNRYLCKFEYMLNDFNEKGCVGCGRCTAACAGEIDIREVMDNMLKSTKQTRT